MATLAGKVEMWQESMHKWEKIWHANQLIIAEGEDSARFTNKQIAECKHFEKIFGDTRVKAKEPDFFMKTCKRSRDAVSNHPVLLMGQWRQGKSSLVNSLQMEAEKEKNEQTGLMLPACKANVGRRDRTTNKVSLYPLEAGDVGTIWLADTPGLEPDKSYDIMGLLKSALKERNCSEDVFTDLIVLVIAGTPQGISGLSSHSIIEWIRDTYHKARQGSSSSCVILPVLTHGDHIDQDNLDADRECVKERLVAMSTGPGKKVAACDQRPDVLDPMVVCNHAIKQSGIKAGTGIKEVKDQILKLVESRTQTKEFRLQWSHLQTDDLRKMVHRFRQQHPDEETERRLFHRTLEGILATYGKKTPNMDTAFPQPAWDLIPLLERKLRGEESTKDRLVGGMLFYLPCSPNSVVAWGLLAGVSGLGTFAFKNKGRLLHSAASWCARWAGSPK